MDPRYRKYIILRGARLVTMALSLASIVFDAITRTKAWWLVVAFLVLLVASFVLSVFINGQYRKIRNERLALTTPAQQNAASSARLVAVFCAALMAVAILLAVLALALPSVRVGMLVTAGLLFATSVAVFFIERSRIRRRLAMQFTN